MSVWGALVALSPPTDENGLKSLQMSDTEETEAHHGAVHSVQNNENKESTSVVVFLHKPRVVFGRNKNSTVVLTGNPCLSSTHCDLSAARRVSHSNGDDKDSDMPVVSFADHSSNGCRLNGKMIGKGSIVGPLRSGDVLEFVNAGQGSNTRHNLAFRFYHIQHYEELQQKPPVLLPFAGTETHAVDSSPTNKREVIHNEVCKVSVDKAPTVDHLIPWALARRMHRHSVDEFYELRRDNPLGHGAFSVVYAATLRPSVALTIISSTAANEVITCPPPPPPLPLPPPLPPLLQPSSLVPCAQNSGGAVCVHGAGDAEESVLWFLEQRPPCSVVNAAASALRQHRLNCNDRTEAGAVYNFAVKIIEKQRMIFPAQAGAHAQEGNDITYENKECLEKNSKGTNEATLQRLVALETQRDEMEWECAQAIHVRSNHNNKSENIESRQIAKKEEKEEAEEWTKKKKMEVIDAQQRKSNRAMRARLREDLLIALTPHTRRRYERELQQRTRHRREIDILFEVDHPAITRLHEVFDGERQLAFVMERATGGDIFGLLERYGPLPEFVVKVIIVQVLEAVQYLHRMGIIHRDLKLENLLLRVPFEVESFCQVQRGVMMQQLAQYHAALSSSSSSSSSSTSSSLLLSSLFTWLGTTEPREQRVPNPLSPLYTVHVNRALWPAVQISDFGLSCMLRGPCTDTGEGDDSLLYTRHDMTTICGTPIYVAPEVVIPSLRPPQRGGYSAAVDLFSVGVIAFALLTGCAPFSPRPHPNYNTHFVNNPHQQQQQQKQKQKQQHLDYTAPLCWERRRERKRGAAANTQSPIATTIATGANTTTCGGDSDASAHCNRSDRDGLFPSIAHKTEVRLWGDAPAIKDAARQTLRALQVAEEGSLLREDVMSRATALLPAVSPLAQELIAALLSPNPRERPTAADALAHPWFSDCRQVAEAQR